MQMPVPWHENDSAEIGEKIRQQRKKQKITQEELAEQMEFQERNTIYRHEKGQNEMSICTLLRYADVLQVEPQSLLPDRYQIDVSSERTQEACRILEQLSDDNYRKILDLAKAMLAVEPKMHQI